MGSEVPYLAVALALRSVSGTCLSGPRTRAETDLPALRCGVATPGRQDRPLT